MEAWPDALRLFGHLRSLDAPLRLPDFAAWVRALGCAPFPVPCGAFQATPMRHRGTVAGGFFLGGKAGGFTDADEERQVLFRRLSDHRSPGLFRAMGTRISHGVP